MGCIIVDHCRISLILTAEGRLPDAVEPLLLLTCLTCCTIHFVFKPYDLGSTGLLFLLEMDCLQRKSFYYSPYLNPLIRSVLYGVLFHRPTFFRLFSPSPVLRLFIGYRMTVLLSVKFISCIDHQKRMSKYSLFSIFLHHNGFRYAHKPPVTRCWWLPSMLPFLPHHRCTHPHPPTLVVLHDNPYMTSFSVHCNWSSCSFVIESFTNERRLYHDTVSVVVAPSIAGSDIFTPPLGGKTPPPIWETTPLPNSL